MSPWEREVSEANANEAVHAALIGIGSVPLDNYVAALTARASPHSSSVPGQGDLSRSATATDKEVGPMEATSGPALRFDSTISASVRAHTSFKDPEAALAIVAARVHPLSLLPISPSSKLGKRMMLSRTGTVKDSYPLPMSLGQGQCLPQL